LVVLAGPEVISQDTDTGINTFLDIIMNLRTKNPRTDGRPAIGQADSGIFLIDKPAGPSSFRIVQQIRRALHMKKVGHAGTLDPFATGLLIVCAGRKATRTVPLLMEGEKEYEATLKLGIETVTHDPEGETLAVRPVPEYSAAEITACLQTFHGVQLQTPPQYSAVKHNGKPLYYYARRGITVAKEPRQVEISAIDTLGRSRDELIIRVTCSKGTYIRVLAADIGRTLGCGAHLKALRRVRSGPFTAAAGLPGNKLANPDEAHRLLVQYQLPVAAVKVLLERENGSLTPNE
jgi:tRNA pseudouridine55 synthase